MTKQTGNDSGRHLRALLQTFKPDVYKITLTAGVFTGIYFFVLILVAIRPSLALWLATPILLTLALLTELFGYVYGVVLGLLVCPLAVIYGLICMWWTPLPARGTDG